MHNTHIYPRANTITFDQHLSASPGWVLEGELEGVGPAPPRLHKHKKPQRVRRRNTTALTVRACPSSPLGRAPRKSSQIRGLSVFAPGPGLAQDFTNPRAICLHPRARPHASLHKSVAYLPSPPGRAPHIHDSTRRDAQYKTVPGDTRNCKRIPGDTRKQAKHKTRPGDTRHSNTYSPSPGVLGVPAAPRGTQSTRRHRASLRKSGAYLRSLPGRAPRKSSQICAPISLRPRGGYSE